MTYDTTKERAAALHAAMTAEAPSIGDLFECVGTENWDCDGQPFTPQMRMRVLQYILSNHGEFLELGDDWTLDQLLMEEQFDHPYGYTHLNCDELADWVSAFLYGRWDLDIEAEDPEPIKRGLDRLDEWYASLRIRDLREASGWRTSEG